MPFTLKYFFPSSSLTQYLLFVVTPLSLSFIHKPLGIIRFMAQQTKRIWPSSNKKGKISSPTQISVGLEKVFPFVFLELFPNYKMSTCCANCKFKCVNVSENVTRTPSRNFLVEANQHHRKKAHNELVMKVSVWGAASPPTAGDESKYSIDLIALEKANALKADTIVLTKALSIEPIKSFGDEEEDEGEETLLDDDESIDDDDTASSAF